MSVQSLFSSVSSIRIAEIVRSARRTVCFAGPGIQIELARAFNWFIDDNEFFNQNPPAVINFEQNPEDLSGGLDRVPMVG